MEGADMNKPVGYSSDDPEAVRQEQLRMIQAEYDDPKYKADRPALAREIARLGGTMPKVESPLSQVVTPQTETVTEAGALSSMATPEQPAPVVGALASRSQAPDIAAMLKQYIPQDDSQSRYLALAQGFGAGTRHGTFGEQVANVAGALQSHKQEQEKLRSQYVPLIMQQVAKQQAMEEQAAIRREQQQFQIQESQRAQAAKLAADKAQQAERIAAQAFQAEENRKSRESMAADQIAARSAAAAAQARSEGKPPAGYAWGPVGDDGLPTQVVIKGGPADLKAGAIAQQKALGASDVDSAVASLRDAYDRLEKGGGITSTKDSALSNMGAAASSSGLGQMMGKALGTQNQSARNDIAMTRPALLAALMKATGMSAKQMDSNAELKLWLATATDPTLDVESNRRALNAIERKYLSAGEAPKKPEAGGAEGSWDDKKPSGGWSIKPKG